MGKRTCPSLYVLLKRIGELKKEEKMKQFLKVLWGVMRTIIFFYWTVLLCVIILTLTSQPNGSQFLRIEDPVHILFVLVGVVAFSGLLFVLLRVLKNRKRDFRPLVWGALGVGLVLFYIDGPSPELNYAITDLVQPQEMAPSYEALMRYKKGNKLEFPLSEDLSKLSQTWSNLLPCSEAIETAWESCADGRNYLHDLDQFSAIADYIDYTGPPAEVPLPSFTTWRTIARTYWLYSMLKVQQGEIDEGIKVLSQLHSVVRKSLPNSTSLVSKMINIAVAKGTIRTGNYMIREIDFTPKQLLALKEAFPPLNDKDISLRRIIISEYYNGQYYASIMKSTDEDFPDMFASNPVLKTALFTVWPFVYKQNNTLADLKQLYEPLLSDIDNCNTPQSLTDALSQMDDYLATRKKRPTNLLGAWFLQIAIPSYNKVAHSTFKTKAYSDLLALEIHKKLGKELELKDTYTEKNYLFDETRQCFFSPGPDGLSNTADDIYISQS